MTRARRPMRRRQPIRLSTAVSLMVSAVIAAVLLVVYLFSFFHISTLTRDGVRDKALAVARTLADSPQVQSDLMLPPGRGAIQPIASAVQQSNDLLFVVVTDMNGIRYSHPNAVAVGQHFIGDDLTPALRGAENVAVNHGQLAEALRTFTPVFDARGRQIGVVAIGISLSEVSRQVSQARRNMLWIALFGALVGAAGTFLLVRAAKRILLGLEPYEISALFEQRQALLQSVKEGVIAVNERGAIVLVNRAARRLMRESSIHPHVTPYPADALGPLIALLEEVLACGEARRDREINFKGQLLLCNIMPVRSGGIITGAVCTLRDKTEVSQLMQRMDGLVNYVDALRERSHEFMNKLHVILGLLHLKNYAELEKYVLSTASGYQTGIAALPGKIKPPAIAGFLISKVSRAAASGNRLLLSDDCLLPDEGSERQVAVLITVLGNLIENALDAFGSEGNGEIGVLLHYQNGALACVVSDDGPGIAAHRLDDIFNHGFSTKGADRGIGLFLAKQQVESLGGSLSVESEPGVYTQFFVQLPWDRENKNA